jgi:superfamily II DNA or RNA helicase
VIFDECQEMRHSGSIKYDAAKHIADAAKYRIGLSATPILNYGGEIFNVVEVLSPGALGDRTEFCREWCTAGYNEKPRLQDPAAFGMYLREQGIMLRRTRREVGRELPPLTIIPHLINADMEALDRVAGSATELAKIILAQGGKGFDKMQASQELDWRLRQATGIAKALYAADFVRLLVESGESVVMYGWHREVYSLWLQRLKDLAPAMFTGTESPYEKEESKRRFVEGETPVLIMSLRAGQGLDGLQGKARTVVIGELDWSPGVHEQGIGRVYRDGQTEPCVAYYLLSNCGSDPVIAGVLGLKKAQVDGIRDPNAKVIMATAKTEDNVRKLAEEFLKQRGVRGLPQPDVEDQDEEEDPDESGGA